MKESSNKRIAIIKMAVAMFIFGTIGVFVRHVSLPSGFIAFFRGISGTVFLIAVMLISKKKISFAAIKSNLLLLVLSGMFIGINWILLFEAYRYTTVATATLFYYLSPVFVIIASPFVLKEKLTIRKLICIICALFGIVLVSGVVESGIVGGRGMLLGCGAAVFYAIVVLLNKKMKDISSYDMTIVQLFSAAVTILPYTLLTENITKEAFTAKSIIVLLILGAVHTGLAYALYFASVKSLPAQTAAIFSYIDPVVAIILSALLLSEPITLFGIIGAILILGSTFVASK